MIRLKSEYKLTKNGILFKFNLRKLIKKAVSRIDGNFGMNPLLSNPVLLFG